MSMMLYIVICVSNALSFYIIYIYVKASHLKYSVKELLHEHNVHFFFYNFPIKLSYVIPIYDLGNEHLGA